MLRCIRYVPGSEQARNDGFDPVRIRGAQAGGSARGRVWSDGFLRAFGARGRSDVGAMAVSARKVDGGWILNGAKAWVSNAGDSTWYPVMAVTDAATGKPDVRGEVRELFDP